MIKYFHIYIYFLVSKRIIVTINRYIIVDKYEYITNRYYTIKYILAIFVRLNRVVEMEK